MFLDQLLFELSCKNPETCRHTHTHTHTHTNTHTCTHARMHTHTHTDSDEYSIVVFCKNVTIVTCILIYGGPLSTTEG